ncbi:MAG: thiamine pyrophosphate-dependent dehydrogenase E1 component subunit alpha [Chthoniobacterales bacterium]
MTRKKADIFFFMSNTLKELKRDVVPSGFQEQYIKAFNWMLLARTVEDKIVSLWRAGKISGGVYIGRGQEAISVALGMRIRPGDIFGPLIRDQAGRFAAGEGLLEVVRTYLGSRFGVMRGRDGNVHRGRPREGSYAMISHLGALISVVAGGLLARRLKGDHSAIGATTIGDGGTSTGAFHEAMNMAAVERLPLVVVVVNNQYAYSTPNSRQFRCRDLVDRAIGYGIDGYSTDATDLKECMEVVNHAVERARAGRGPQMVVGACLRLSGHAGHDDASYMDQTLFQTDIGRDCLEVAEAYLLEQQWADLGSIEQWKEDARTRVEEAIIKVQREPPVSPDEEDWCPFATRRFVDTTLAA